MGDNSKSKKLTDYLREIKDCRLCEKYLPMGPNPVVQASVNSRILVVGQAPGIKVHQTGIAFNDPSGDRLRQWMGISRDDFYDKELVALVPMGFCYPGRGKSGDLPPRVECEETWRADLLAQLNSVEMTLVLGHYAQTYHLGKKSGATLTDTVRKWREFWPNVIPLPHPSPRNNLWLRKNPWVESEIIPKLQQRITRIIS